MAVALCGCANSDFDTSGAWFSKPLDLFGRGGGYTFSQLGESRADRPITANDLVDANGACPAPASGRSVQGNADASAPGPPEGAALGGIAVGMSECDVVARNGRPTAINLGNDANGGRTAVLTFTGGLRPGIYRFVGGRLTQMDRVEEPAPAAQQENKKSAKTKKNKKPQDTRDTAGLTR